MPHNNAVVPLELDNSAGLTKFPQSPKVSSITITTLSNENETLRERKDGLSYLEILINFLKGMVGPGCLSLPLAFRQAGLWTGLALVFGLGFLNLICMQKLVKCSQRLSRNKGNVSFLNYGNVAYETFSTSFSVLRPYNRVAKIVINSSIISLQMGICSVFYVFCAEHIKEFFDFKFASSVPFSKSAWMLLIFVPMALMNFIRSLRPIAKISLIGNIICIIALLFIFQHLIRAEHRPIHSLPSLTNFNGIMTACGAVLYSFEGQAMVLPLENRLKNPAHMNGPFGILAVGITVVSTVYAASGFLGFLTYGPNVEASITQNLPQKQTQFMLVRLAFTLVMYIGFVIQMYVIVDMLWPEIVKFMDKMWHPSESRDNNNGIGTLCLELFFRTLLVVIAMSIALAVPNLEDIIPLVGATTGMLLALIFPALLDLLVFLPVHLRHKHSWRALWLFCADSALIGVGIFGLIAGLRANVHKILHFENA